MTTLRKFYLDKVEGKILGVCSGLADYTGINALWIRVGAVMLTLFVSFFTIPLYIVTALLADNKPLLRLGDGYNGGWRERDSYRDATAARVRDIERGSAGYTYEAPTNATLSAEIDRLR